MGAGIAEVCARAGVDVLVYEPTDELAAAGRDRILRRWTAASAAARSPNASASRPLGG